MSTAATSTTNPEVVATADHASVSTCSSVTLDINLSQWKEHGPLCDFVRMVRCSPFVNKPKVILETMRVEGWRIMRIDDCSSMKNQLKPITDEVALLSSIHDMLQDRDLSTKTAAAVRESLESHTTKIPAARPFVSPTPVLSSHLQAIHLSSTSMPISNASTADRSPFVVQKMRNGSVVPAAAIAINRVSLSQQRGRSEYTSSNLALMRMELREMVLANALGEDEDDEDNRLFHKHGSFSSPRKQQRSAQLAQVARTPLSKKVRSAQHRAALPRLAFTRSAATLQGILKPTTARLFPHSASSIEKQAARRVSFSALLQGEDMTMEEPTLFSPLPQSERFKQAARRVSYDNSLPINEDTDDDDVAHSPPAVTFNSPSSSLVDHDDASQRPSSIPSSPVKQNRKCGITVASSNYLMHMDHDFESGGASSPLLFEEPLRDDLRDEAASRLLPLKRNIELDNLVNAAAIYSSSLRIVSPEATMKEKMDLQVVGEATSLSMINVNGAASTTTSIALPLLTASPERLKSPPSMAARPRGKTLKRIINKVNPSNNASNDLPAKKVPSTIAAALPEVSAEKLKSTDAPLSAMKVSMYPRGRALKTYIDKDANQFNNDMGTDAKVAGTMAASRNFNISPLSPGERVGRIKSASVETPPSTPSATKLSELDQGVARASKTGSIRGKQLSLVAAASIKIEAASKATTSQKRKVARGHKETKIVRRSKRLKAVVAKSDSASELPTAFNKADVLFCEAYDSKTHNHVGNIKFLGYVTNFLNHFDRLHPVDRHKVASLLVGHYMLHDPTVRFLTESPSGAAKSTECCWRQMQFEESIHRTSTLIDTIREKRLRETTTKALSLHRAKLHDKKKLAFLRRILTEKCKGKKSAKGGKGVLVRGGPA